MSNSSWKRWEFLFIILYALAFFFVFIRWSLQLSHDHSRSLYGLRPGWMSNRLNDLSDAQWRNFRGNLPILTLVMCFFTFVANILRYHYCLKGRGMSFIWIILSLCYLSYLHEACVIFVLSIASANYFIVKTFARSPYYMSMLWIFNITFLILNRVYEGYSFSLFGGCLAFLDNYRGTFRWHICFNLVVLRMISYGCDYHWSNKLTHFDQKKHMLRCHFCSSGRTCYHVLQERSMQNDKYSFNMYVCYLTYAPLYIAGPIVSFNAFATQLDAPQKNYSVGQIAWYGLRWILSLLLMETVTHFFYYNAFAISGLWRQLSPFEVFIIGYGVLNFMWLKFFLIWRYFRFWSLIGGIETPENMPKCINNCYNLEGFWKNWHASFNKWLVRYMYIPLGGSQRKLLNVWVIFTFVAIWHDLEWKLLSWAWLTCLFFIPEILVKSSVNSFQLKCAAGMFIHRELSAIAGAVTITCLMFYAGCKPCWLCYRTIGHKLVDFTISSEGWYVNCTSVCSSSTSIYLQEPSVLLMYRNARSVCLVCIILCCNQAYVSHS
uniref:Membrane-bound O-acyltransferase C24H6.01c isoform X3 n=1 Tax=Elaeis guineensis var. tenera TaxID=51953 RepID=A0A6J0PMZ8_ELAGV|nr:putative membrane-bound O-acyltransferase C24H6.01c isoform X3 [Elaeis guineensis]XP_010929815.1 putative membrane-bound O-acyltransferase C24H6.01c isoform X3 [Elaeis guineensis]XP_019708520.1 putative membrane-bound O-acyltransferase C24H6.01c isoform X3 [Elaeis guineensis]